METLHPPVKGERGGFSNPQHRINKAVVLPLYLFLFLPFEFGIWDLEFGAWLLCIRAKQQKHKLPHRWLFG
jgi:hypothetical protein